MSEDNFRTERTMTHEYWLGMPVSAYMEENDYNGKFSNHWSTPSKHVHVDRLYTEADVKSLLERLGCYDLAMELMEHSYEA